MKPHKTVNCINKLIPIHFLEKLWFCVVLCSFVSVIKIWFHQVKSVMRKNFHKVGCLAALLKVSVS